MRYTGIVKVVLTCATIGAAYFVGQYRGFYKGQIEERTDIVSMLCDDRLDAQQNAIYAGSLKEQEKILEHAAVINITLDYLERGGHIKGVPKHIVEQAFKYSTKR